MWNLKAKYLCCGNEQWLDFLSQSFSYAHTDYPLFLPCILARTSSYIGEFKSTVSLLFSWIFSISNFILNYLYIKKLRDIKYAIFSICLLSLSPNLYIESGKQYSDLLLSLFFLISTYELILWNQNRNSKSPYVCIIFSSICLWTKNEGLPWFALYSLIIIFFIYKKNKPKQLVAFIASLPAIISSVSVKYISFNSNNILLNITDRLYQLIDPIRYKYIIIYTWDFLSNNLWLIIISISIVFNYKEKQYSDYALLLLLPLSMYFCYFIVYLLSPDNLSWHLDTSFPRIMTPLLPTLMFLGCLVFSVNKNNS